MTKKKMTIKEGIEKISEIMSDMGFQEVTMEYHPQTDSEVQKKETILHWFHIKGKIKPSDNKKNKDERDVENKIEVAHR